MYLRKRVPGAPQDPTMTHVDDPWSFHAGEYIRRYGGLCVITAIDDNMFDDPDIRFAHTIRVRVAAPNAVIHDEREHQVETFVWGAVSKDGTPITLDQARRVLSEMYPDA
jgi:hypothetical protein